MVLLDPMFFFPIKNILLGTKISLPKDDFPSPKVGCVSSLEGRIFHKSSHRNLHKCGTFQQNLRHWGDLSSSLNSKPKSFHELKGLSNLTYCRYSKYLHLTLGYLLQGPSFSISNFRFQGCTPISQQKINLPFVGLLFTQQNHHLEDRRSSNLPSGETVQGSFEPSFLERWPDLGTFGPIQQKWKVRGYHKLHHISV